MKSKITFLEAKKKLEAICAYQEKCQFDIEVKLTGWMFDEEQKNQLIAHLITHNFINEERYAEAFVNDKYKIKKWGKQKIIAHLKQKRISSYSSNKALKNIDLELYYNNLLNISQKKWSELKMKKDDVWILRNKLMNHLASKGYENDLIFDVVAETIKS